MTFFKSTSGGRANLHASHLRTVKQHLSCLPEIYRVKSLGQNLYLVFAQHWLEQHNLPNKIFIPGKGPAVYEVPTKDRGRHWSLQYKVTWPEPEDYAVPEAEVLVVKVLFRVELVLAALSIHQSRSWVVDKVLGTPKVTVRETSLTPELTCANMNYNLEEV